MGMGIEQTLGTPLAAAVRAAGSQSAFGRIIERSQSTVYQWLSDDRPLPAEYVQVVYKATGIPPARLRPDLFDPPAATNSTPEASGAPA